MPKIGVHYIVLSEVLRQINAIQDQQSSTNLLNQKSVIDNVNSYQVLNSHSSAATIGSIGPDLFFWAPDYEFMLRLRNFYNRIGAEILDLFLDISDTVNKVKTHQDIGPVDNPVSTLHPTTISYLRTLLVQARETTSKLHGTLNSIKLSGANSIIHSITGFDTINEFSSFLFNQFLKPPLQDNQPVSQWYWFDMLHYRNTGKFARNLIENSGNNPLKLAYSYGYLSHIATDIVGHAYVNQIVGGPYRLYPQRHVLVENYIDAWQFFEEYELKGKFPDLQTALLSGNTAILFGFSIFNNGKGISTVLPEKLNLPNKLPEDIVDLLEKTFHDTYANTDHPTRPQLINNNGFLSKDDIRDTYAMMAEIFKLMERFSIRRPEEPFNLTADIIEKAWQDIWETPPFPEPPDLDTAACSAADIFSFGFNSKSRDCWTNFFNNIRKIHKYLHEMMMAPFEALFKLLDFLAALPVTLPLILLLVQLYLIQVALYEIHKFFRFSLVIEGLLYPEPEDLTDSFARNMISPFQCENKGPLYPILPSPNQDNHIICPSKGFIENPPTEANFNTTNIDLTKIITPSDFIYNKPFNFVNFKRYADSLSPNQTRELYDSKVSIGNATTLALLMIKIAEKPSNFIIKEKEGKKLNVDTISELKDIIYSDFNLDSDRGYGYKTWIHSGQLPKFGNQNEIVEDEKYL